MTTSQLMAELRSRLSNSAAIGAFCQEYFGKSLTVLRRYDDNAPPKPSDHPWISLELLGDQKSNKTQIVVRTVFMVCSVWRDPDGTADDGEDRASDLRELAEKALMSPGLGKVEAGDDVFANAEDGCFDSATTIIITNK
ncbi:hypothetical protein DesfrDRAFT_0153 [Solidesulfovibrio fructosivorans JJ]]|uniref:Phage protein n=1 Tax=Solidesulfovibrio fructosivorans JJ] TaxID=596151 RepID=E1JRA4_SOLFR|nr:hypothetical protein [Solidesulfovibrio fructosivorans]EFL53105.1 hypothetical protein DesfrDRAFT_0153 [Solidesulfovibrio fructosivorans JJ]]